MDKVLGGDSIVTVFLIGELCLVPEGILCLFDLIREDGGNDVLLRVGDV